MAKYSFYILACVPKANIVTNKSTSTMTAYGTRAGANWLSKYIFFLKFQIYTKFLQQELLYNDKFSSLPNFF
ncbi:MAG: hypothetical protein EAZ85_00440 [Bacteroidetes bacterium]|nr:MAG: hypothetical protein EAZ85_00440 [Bacteroidota bacterium]TAG90317.1 MAG: hypothetical protein EAZ20_04525 [Bacteroidota bacterium]